MSGDICQRTHSSVRFSCSRFHRDFWRKIPCENPSPRFPLDCQERRQIGLLEPIGDAAYARSGQANPLGELSLADTVGAEIIG